MTDRVHALTVVLEEDMRTDDVEALINAIRMMRNVADVSTHVTNISTHTAETRARAKIHQRLFEALKP